MGRESRTLVVGLDVHKDSIDIAVADAPRDAEIRHLGSIKGDLASLDKAIRKLVSRGQPLQIVCEAGPCGFVIRRHLGALGLRCGVVAPSSIVRPPGERSKTGRRDAMPLARLARWGDLSVVRVPDAADESVRDLVQALQALHGVQLIAAMTLVAELQDFLRFESPRRLMANLGLVPAQHSSGPKRLSALRLMKTKVVVAVARAAEGSPLERMARRLAGVTLCGQSRIQASSARALPQR